MKKTTRSGLFAVLAIAAAAVSALVAGCESADSYSISISPNYAKVKPGQSVTLNASGWSDYSWTLDNESGAHLSGTTGKSVVFYAEAGASNAVFNVVATAVGSGSVSGSGTNSVSSAGYTAKAKIVVE